MTVYFIKRVSDGTQIKIGSTSDLKSRLSTHASAFGDIRLFAQCAGGLEVERLYQKAFSHRRLEGEWFQAEEDILAFIAENADAVDVVVPRRVLAWTVKATTSRDAKDSAIGAKLMADALALYPATMRLGAAQEDLFLSLQKVNPLWTRRRVRSIYQADCRRVDLFEIIDLLGVLGIPRHEWADVLDPVEARETLAGSGR